MFRRLTIALLIPFSLSLLSCGGSGGGGSKPGQPALVTQLQTQDSELKVGDGTVLFTDIAYDVNDVFNFGDNIEVVVRLPSGVSYRNNTAELDGGKGGDSGLFPRITQCLSGITFLEFDLDDNDLSTAVAPNGDSDARIKLTLDADAAVGNVQVQARAARNVLSYSCADPFSFDEAINLFLFAE